MIQNKNRLLRAPVSLLLATILLLPAILCTVSRAEEEATGTSVSNTSSTPEEEGRLDHDLATSYQQFFSPFSAADTMSALQMMPVEAFLSALKAGEPQVVLDIRTPGETAVIGFTLTDTLAVPMDQVFTTDILNKLKGRKVVVVCQGGHRATAVALALRHVGLDDIWILKGGTAALAAQLNPKSAY